MKIFYHFLIIIFVIVSLLIIKDDAISIYYKGVSYIKNNISTIKDIPKNIKGLFLKEVYKEDTPTQTISPGPLRVLNEFFTYDSSSLHLSLEKVIEVTNNERRNNGDLPLLTMNYKLNLSAQKKLQDMFSNQYFEHISPDGVGVSELANEVSYEYILIGENLALGNFKDEKSLLDAWMASPGHRANILNTHYTEIGVAVGRGKFEGKNIWLAVQHFGLPKSFCPSIDEVLRGLISIRQEKIVNTESDLLLRKTNIDNGVVYDGTTKNEQAKEYNSIVIKYNEIISDIKNKIDRYNKQVADFNLCVENALNIAS